MIWLRIVSPFGVQAEFTMDSAVMAVDLALRSERTGLSWRAEDRRGVEPEPLTLPQLRALALAVAETEAERRALDEVEWEHEVAASFNLN